MNDREQLKNEFLEKWTLENVKNMKLEDYTNLDKDNSFTYWLETKTSNVLGIGGGSSYKFGIFKRNPNAKEEKLKSSQLSDANREYGWYSKYGLNKDEAFKNILEQVVKVIEFAQNNSFSKIDNINLGNSYKWKLAFMYAPKDSLLRIAQDKGFYYLEKKYLKTNNKVISNIQKELIKLKPNSKDFNLFSDELWNDYYQNNITEKEFKSWLNNSKKLVDSTIDKYVKRLKSSIPKELVKVGIFEHDLSLFDSDIEELESILEELKPNGQLYQWNISSIVKNEASASLGNYIDFLNEDNISDLIKNNNFEGKNNMLNDTTQTQPLNQILYGPPGTGKTYKTINKALEIIFEKENTTEIFEFKIKDENGKEIEPTEKTYKKILEIVNENKKRKHLKGLFEYFKNGQQIEFVTFHQSYGYEEFIEGIKAETKDEKISYEIKSGIFKKLCEKAYDKEFVINDISINENSSIWKISLGSTYENEIKTKCFNDNEIRIGWTDIQEVGDENFNKLGSNNKSTIKNFIEDMKIGDLVISIYNQNSIDGIGIIESDFSIDDHDHYNKCRKVKWLSKDIMDLTQLNNNKVFVQKTVYKIDRFKPKNLLSLIKQNEFQIKNDNTTKNYILIIDEINRGNISKIFGELITLIEDSKRLGKNEQIEITLPYSGEKFGVPENLYIIGTMNTADRSIAQMDTALRRRFEFIEMLPNLKVLSKKDSELSEDEAKNNEPNSNDLKVEKINIRLLLKAINERIEYIYDREHQIGHSYFMPLIKTPTKDKLDEIFRVNIIPLLAEYFYGDWADIKVILNDKENNFITVKEESELSFEMMNSRRKKNKIYNVNPDVFSIDAYINIYKKTSKQANETNNN